MEPSPHILIVDDSADIREPLAKYLGKAGMRTSTADGGTEMRRLLKTSAIDLVVLDIMMPGEDGLALCRMLRETTDLPVILLTAMAEDTDRVVGLEIGADDYVTKPFNPRELLARVKAVLRRSRVQPAQSSLPQKARYRFDRLDARYCTAGDHRRRWPRDPAQHDRVSSAHRLHSPSAHGAVARAAPRPHQRPVPRTVRTLDRQPGEPASQEDRGRSQDRRRSSRPCGVAATSWRAM